MLDSRGPCPGCAPDSLWLPPGHLNCAELGSQHGAHVPKGVLRRLVPPKAARRYDECLTYSMVSAKKALQMAGLDPKANSDAFEARPGLLSARS